MGKAEQGVAQSKGRYQVIPRTLSFVRHGDDVLLLRGAPTKRLWPNRYNGVGGHIERNEDILSAALREIQEETGLTARDARLCAVVHVDAGDGQTGILVFVFTAEADTRQTIPSAEGDLEWVPQAQVLEKDLVEDLRILLPRVLSLPTEDPALCVHYSYDEHDQLVIEFADEQQY
jgi:8-oxo-dGTP diphosphatase